MAIHTPYTRKRIDLKLPDILIQTMDKYCFEQKITRTAYIENLIKKNLSELKRIIIIKNIPITWNDIKDIPLKPKSNERITYDT